MTKFKNLKKKMPLYWAYGSNMSHCQMRHRCPAAKPLTKIIVRNLQLVFRGVADVAIEDGARTPGGIYRITPVCERSLDDYEGVDSGIYEKCYFKVKVNGIEEEVMFYKMRKERGVMPPSEDYLERIVRGYEDFDAPLAMLEDAVQKAWDNTRVTEKLRGRFIRNGQQKLATPEFFYQPIKTEPIRRNYHD